MSRSWRMLRLEECSSDKRRVATIISITVTDDRVAVYASLEVGSADSGINIVEFEVRCPRIVRDLIGDGYPWHHGNSMLHVTSRQATGFDDGVFVADEIVSKDRCVPLIVVAESNGEQVLPHGDQKLAYELVGLANIVRVDEGAAWALTDALGPMRSCFDGGVRIYWPGMHGKADPFSHPLWSAMALKSMGSSLLSARDRLVKQFRDQIMRASALGAKRPREIDEIRDYARSKALADMRARAESLADYMALAEEFASENTALKNENAELLAEIDRLESSVVSLEGKCNALQRRADTADARLKERESSGDKHCVNTEESVPPKLREVRFYKKTYSAPGHDIVVQIADCGHDEWQSATKADKARKGILKHEGLEGLRSLKHCGSCVGGGVWRVEW